MAKKCIAITTKGKQCCNSMWQMHLTLDKFCGIHMRYKPTNVIINNTIHKYDTYIKNAHVNANAHVNQIEDLEFPQLNAKQQQLRPLNEKQIQQEIERQKEEIERQKEEKLKNERERQAYEDKQMIEMLEKVSQITECYCCKDNEFLNAELYHCTKTTDLNPHLVCNECFRRNIKCQMETGTATLKCMFDASDHCGGVYTEQQITDILTTNVKLHNSVVEHNLTEQTHSTDAFNPYAPDTQNIQNAQINQPKPKLSDHSNYAASDNDNDLLEKFKDCLVVQEITELANICDNYQICPLCNKFGCIVEPDQANQWMYLKCGRCNGSWCSKCKRESHGNEHCYKLIFKYNETDAQQIQFIDRMIQEIATDKLTHSCNKCNTKFIKEEGCNLMTCGKCGAMKCYICDISLEPKNGNKYWHFSNHPDALPNTTCRLWNCHANDKKLNQGNTEYNIKTIFKELTTFMRVNEYSTQVKIYKRVYENFKNDEPKDIIKRELSYLQKTTNIYD